MRKTFIVLALAAMSCIGNAAFAQRYNGGLIDKIVAVVGGEMISLADIEAQVQMMRAQGLSSDRNMRCEILEQMLESKLFLMQARIDSLSINSDMVENQLSSRIDEYRSYLGGDEGLEEYYGKPLYRLREEWRQQLEDMSLTQQEQSNIAETVPEMTPYDVKQYLDTVDVNRLPVVPIKYQMSQICIYPDREAASLAVKERLLELRERIINGEKFATLARIYSEDGAARRGGELGMASRTIYWPAFSDAAMALRPGTISQIVETPDGFHLIEVLEKKGDMFNARHIILKPQYTQEDQDKAFKTLDSLRTEILNKAVTFELAARFYSEDPATRTNGGQMADPNTGSSYFEIDQIKPQDYAAISDLQEGEISIPIASRDNEGLSQGREGNLVYKIIRLDKVLPAHTATFENDFTDIAAQVRYEKQMKVIDQFIDGKIKETYIVLDPMFKDCEFNRSEWAGKFREE
ncbi:MAG: peptidylprolyl isomerase [Bacteroidales bacterium]|nr:peptidylprolyl isomerase [Bacteroidales bacterium]